MRESMVSLERRVPHASEAVVPLERGVHTHPWRAARSGREALREHG
jgi:hypothetical protein